MEELLKVVEGSADIIEINNKELKGEIVHELIIRKSKPDKLIIEYTYEQGLFNWLKDLIGKQGMVRSQTVNGVFILKKIVINSRCECFVGMTLILNRRNETE